MGKYIFLIITIFFLIAGILFFARGKKALFGNFDERLAPPASRAEEPKSLGAQVSNEAEVTIEVTPSGFSTAGIDFNITFTTHSVDLDFDLLQSSRLYSGSEELQPLSWSGGRGGHHLSGVLKFPPLKSQSGSFKLTIEDASLVKERVFEWIF